MSQNAHTAVLSRGPGAGGAIGLGHSVVNPPGTNMNLNGSSPSVSWSHANSGASAPGAPATTTHQQQEAKPTPSPQDSNQSGTTLKEHDLLGLSEVSSSTTRGSQSPVQDNMSDEGNDFEELNLKMELGPPAARKNSYTKSASEVPQQQPAPAALESGNSHGGPDGGSLQASEQGAAVGEKSPPNVEQNGAANDQQQQVDRGLSYGVPGGRVDAARPLIDSEALMKWHAEHVGDRKGSNEAVGGLRLGISLHSQRGATQDGVNEKKAFLNSIDRNLEPEPKQQQQQEDPSWQQERSFQEDVSTLEKAQERPSGLQEQQQQQHVVKQQQQLERQKQQQHEAYNQMIEKRPLLERKSLPALQQPEQRFGQNVPERSPRQPEPTNRLWSNQMKYGMVSSTQDYQAQHSAQQDLDSRAGYSVSAGNFAPNRNMYAAPKLGVTGAKRNFDAITGSDGRNVSETRSGLSGPLSVAGGPMNTSNGPSSEVEAKALCQQQMKPLQNGMPMYPSWGQKTNAIPTPSSWHMLEQSGGSFGPFPSQPQRPSRGAPVSKNASEVVSGAGVDAKTWDGQPKGHQEIVSTTSQQKMSAPTEVKQSTNDASPAPAVDAASAAPRAAAAPAAVGWPPLRSFRKNLAVTPRPIPEVPARQSAPQQPASAAPVAGQSNSWYVKVHMDGVLIGRKVDLMTNSSYDKLSQMLDEMFRSFVNGQNGPNRISLASDHKRNFLQGPDYVLTYEDRDGDLMLVGDVPWAMFIDTVKRLRIMKGSEAIGLGTRAAEKVSKAPQPNV